MKWIVDGTSLPDGTQLSTAIPGGGPANNFLPGIVAGNSGQSIEVSQNGSQPLDFAVLHSSYIVNHTGGPTGGAVSTNTRNDTIIYNSPNNFVWGALDRLLWCGIQCQAGNPAQHVGRYIQTIRQSVGRIRRASHCRSRSSGRRVSSIAIRPVGHPASPAIR